MIAFIHTYTHTYTYKSAIVTVRCVLTLWRWWSISINFPIFQSLASPSSIAHMIREHPGQDHHWTLRAIYGTRLAKTHNTVQYAFPARTCLTQQYKVNSTCTEGMLDSNSQPQKCETTTLPTEPPCDVCCSVCMCVRVSVMIITPLRICLCVSWWLVTCLTGCPLLISVADPVRDFRG